MPANITIIHTDDFVRATPDGTLNLEASRQTLTQLVAVVKRTGNDRILVDTREAEPARLSAADLCQLAVALGTQAAIARGRIALLVPPQRKDDAEFFQALARMEGMNLRAFVAFEPAISWLVMREELRI